MDNKTIFSKTGKGVLEIKNQAGKLPTDLVRVLTLIDGKSTVADLTAKSKLNHDEVNKALNELTTAGYIKEFAYSSAGARPGGEAVYVDDLDFTSSLSPGENVYQSAETESRQREIADRAKAEQETKHRREQGDRLKNEQAAKQAQEEGARLTRIEAERKVKEAAGQKLREEAERKAKIEAAVMAQTQRDLEKILEAERNAFELTERKKLEEQQRKANDNAERRAREEAANKAKNDAEEGRRREDDERRRKEEDERKRREEDERKRKEEDERKRKEEDERKRKEEDERRRNEEEERRREEDERKRKEEDERKRKEEDERKRKEEDERKRKQEEERLRREREEADRRREEESRRKREEDERARQAAPAKSDLPEFDVSGLKAMESQVAAEFEKQQQVLRKREEEEERGREQEEQERRALERAEREEHARAEAERREAEDRERSESMDREREDREDWERKRDQEKETRTREQEEAQIASARARLRQDAAKVENERRAREDDLVRRRREQEDRDRKRAEVVSLKKQKGIKTPLDRLKPVVIGVAVLLAVVLGGVQLVPMNSRLPAIRLAASGHIKEPVSIGSMNVSILDGFTINLQSIRIGTAQDVKIDKISLSPEFASLFGDVKIFPKVEVESVTVAQEALSRLPKWFEAVVADKNMRIGRIVVKSIKIESRDVKLPSFNADLQLSPEGAMQKAVLSATDGKLSLEFAPHDNQIDIALSAEKGWVPPFGPQIEFSDLTVKAVAMHNRIRVEKFDALLYGGAAKGSALIVWGGPWSVDGDVATERTRLQDLMAVFTRDAKSTGQLKSKFRYSMSSQALPTLFDSPKIEGSFDIKKGDLDGVDLVRALQSGGRGITQGGATRFEEISGTLALANGHYQYRNMRLSSGLLSATGAFDVLANKDVSGRIAVELRSQAAQIEGKFMVDGDLKAIVLRPNRD